MIATSLAYGRQYQDMLVTHLIRCPRHQSLITSAHLSEEEFDFPIHKAIVLSLKNVFRIFRDSHQHIPAEALDLLNPLCHQLSQMIAVSSIDPMEANVAAQFLSWAFAQSLASDYCFGMVEGFIKHQRTVRLMSRSSLDNPDNFSSMLQQALSSVNLSQTQTRFVPGREMLRPVMQPKLSTGINSLNIRMDGGIGLREYGIVCGISGIGKTSFAIQMARGVVLESFEKAMFASLELPGDMVSTRYYSGISEISYTKLLHGDLELFERLKVDYPDASPVELQNIARDSVWEQMWPIVRSKMAVRANNDLNFVILDYSARKSTIQSLKDDLKREQDLDPENPPKALFVDWLMCLGEDPQFDTAKLAGKEIRHKLQHYGDEFSQWAVAENLAIVGFHQADFTVEGKAKVTMKNSAEGKSAAWKASWYLGVGCDERVRDRGIYTLTLSKARYGRCFSNLQIKADLDTQNFKDYDERVEADIALLAPAGLGREMDELDRQRSQGSMLVPVSAQNQPAADLQPPPRENLSPISTPPAT